MCKTKIPKMTIEEFIAQNYEDAARRPPEVSHIREIILNLSYDAFWDINRCAGAYLHKEEVFSRYASVRDVLTIHFGLVVKKHNNGWTFHKPTTKQ
jgi:hypothetical protein